MRSLLSVCVIAALAATLSACGGGSSEKSDSVQALQRKADLWDIDQIERNWHKAISRHDIRLLMSLYAPDATFTPAPGMTLTGKSEIRHFWIVDAKVTDPRAHDWVLDTPAYKIRETVDGDRGTLYFECDHIDLKTRKVIAVTAGTSQVARIDGRWLITNGVGTTPQLSA
jgi:ketosteroid isomerase-like protein